LSVLKPALCCQLHNPAPTPNKNHHPSHHSRFFLEEQPNTLDSPFCRFSETFFTHTHTPPRSRCACSICTQDTNKSSSLSLSLSPSLLIRCPHNLSGQLRSFILHVSFADFLLSPLGVCPCRNEIGRKEGRKYVVVIGRLLVLTTYWQERRGSEAVVLLHATGDQGGGHCGSEVCSDNLCEGIRRGFGRGRWQVMGEGRE